MMTATEGGGNVKLSVEEIPCRDEEEVIVRCHDAQEKWVEAIRAVTAGEITIHGVADEKIYRLKLTSGGGWFSHDSGGNLCQDREWEC